MNKKNFWNISTLAILSILIPTIAIGSSQINTSDIRDSAITNAKILNSTIDLTAKVTGVLPASNGGTGLSSVLSATSPIFYNSGTGVISSQAATGSLNGYLSSTDWTTFNNKANLVSPSFTTPSLGAATATSINGGSLTGNNSGDQTLSDATISTTDITTNNFTTSKHGFVPKGTNLGYYLKDDGTWAAVSVPVTSVFGRTGAVTATAGDYTETTGGTGQTSYTAFDFLYASATNTLAKLGANTTTTKKFMSMTGTGSAGQTPVWNQPTINDLGTQTADYDFNNKNLTGSANITPNTTATSNLGSTTKYFNNIYSSNLINNALYNATTTGPVLNFSHARGSLASPTITGSADLLGSIQFQGYGSLDGSNYSMLTGASITANSFSGFAGDASSNLKINIWMNSLSSVSTVAIFDGQGGSGANAGRLSLGATAGAKTYDFYANKSLLNYLNLASNAATSTANDLWIDSTQKVFSGFINGIKQWFSTTIYTQTADKTDIANTETSLIGTGVGTVTLPASFFIAGKTIEYDFKGNLTTAVAPPTFTINVKLGSTVISTTGSQTIIGISQTGAFWEIKGTITCRTTGATGSVIGNGEFVYDSTASVGTVNAYGMPSTSTVIATTSSQVFDITQTWGDTNESITSTEGYIKVLN